VITRRSPSIARREEGLAPPLFKEDTSLNRLAPIKAKTCPKKFEVSENEDGQAPIRAIHFVFTLSTTSASVVAFGYAGRATPFQRKTGKCYVMAKTMPEDNPVNLKTETGYRHLL